MTWKFSKPAGGPCSASGLALAIAMAGGGAHAQEAASDAPIQLGEVVIYGAKDANTLNDTSSSIGVATSEQISDSLLRSFRDIFRRLANVLDSDWNDAGFVIRGVNSEGLVPGRLPLAALYVDGVQQTVDGTRRGARGLWDVEQVEVYRGPQSTLSGRAALAGAIYVKTKDPVFENQAEVSATYGNNERAGTALMFNATARRRSACLSICRRVRAQRERPQLPDLQSFARFDDFTTDTYYNLRGKLLFQPREMPETRALLSYSFAHDAPTLDDIGGPGLGFNFDDDRGDINDPVFWKPARPTSTMRGWKSRTTFPRHFA